MVSLFVTFLYIINLRNINWWYLDRMYTEERISGSKFNWVVKIGVSINSSVHHIFIKQQVTQHVSNLMCFYSSHKSNVWVHIFLNLTDYFFPYRVMRNTIRITDPESPNPYGTFPYLTICCPRMILIQKIPKFIHDLE